MKKGAKEHSIVAALKKISLLPLHLLIAWLLQSTDCAEAQVPESLSNGLVSYYTFAGNADDSTGSNNISLYGTTYTTNRFGFFNGALQLTTTSGGYSVNNVGISGNASRTITLWMKPDSGLDWPKGNLISWGGDSPGTTSTLWYEPYHINTPPGFTLGFYGFNTEAHVLTDPADLSDSWHMVTIVYSNTQYDTKFYIDGVLQTSNFFVSTGGDGTLNTTDSPLRVNWTTNDGQYGYSGAISDLAIFDRPLSAAEVSDLYQAQSVPEPSTYALLLLSGATSLYALKRRKR